MHDLTAIAIEAMAPLYPELRRDAPNIHTVMDAEEAAFSSTLRTGTAIFEVAVEENQRKDRPASRGDQAFQLHDTYGFPIDLTLEMAAEQGLSVDEDGFRRLMAEQKDRARRDAAEKKTGNVDVSVFADLLERSGTVTFTGYDQISGEATVVGLLVDGIPVPSAGAGTELDVILDRTPFYAEGGGQLSDSGVITVDGGMVDVVTCRPRWPASSCTAARSGPVRSSSARPRTPRSTSSAAGRCPARTPRPTWCTGRCATRWGSRRPRRARRTRPAASGSTSPPKARCRLGARGREDEVNAVLVNDLDVQAYYTSQEEAREMGALALFGEKYGDRVRVVEVGDYSRELCGGTHVARSGQLGLVKVLGEASIGSGVRRIEALVGLDAFRFLARESVLVSQLSEQLKAPREQLPERISGVLTRLRDAERDLQQLRAARLLESGEQIAAGAEDISGMAFVAHRVPDGTDADDIRKLALDVRGRVPRSRPAVVMMVGVPADRPVVVIAVNEAGRGFGLSAGQLVGVAARALGGGGGGRPDVAQGGGAPLTPDSSVIDEAFGAVRTALRDIHGSAR